MDSSPQGLFHALSRRYSIEHSPTGAWDEAHGRPLGSLYSESELIALWPLKRRCPLAARPSALSRRTARASDAGGGAGGSRETAKRTASLVIVKTEIVNPIMCGGG